MALYRSRGIVLRSMRYGEADRILDLYSRDAGTISAIAKGIRRTRSRFGARLEPFSCVEIMAYHGRTLDTVTQAETLRSFHRVRESLPRLEAAAGMAGYVRALSGGGEGDRRVFNLLYHALDALERRTSAFDLVETAFGLKLSILAGYAPQLDACGGCGMRLDDTGGGVRFAPEFGGVLCEGCRAAVGDSFPLPPEALQRLRELVRRPLRETPKDNRLAEALHRVVRSHVLAHAPGRAPAGPSARAQRPA